MQHDRVGEIRERHDMREVDCPPHAEADLVADANEQQRADQQLAAFNVVQRRHPHHEVQVQEQQAQVEPSAAAPAEPQHRRAQRRVAEVEQPQGQQIGAGDRELEAKIVQRSDAAQDDETGAADERNLDRMDQALALRLACGERLWVEGEAFGFERGAQRSHPALARAHRRRTTEACAQSIHCAVVRRSRAAASPPIGGPAGPKRQAKIRRSRAPHRPMCEARLHRSRPLRRSRGAGRSPAPRAPRKRRR